MRAESPWQTGFSTLVPLLLQTRRKALQQLRGGSLKVAVILVGVAIRIECVCGCSSPIQLFRAGLQKSITTVPTSIAEVLAWPKRPIQGPAVEQVKLPLLIHCGLITNIQIRRLTAYHSHQTPCGRVAVTRFTMLQAAIWLIPELPSNVIPLDVWNLEKSTSMAY